MMPDTNEAPHPPAPSPEITLLISGEGERREVETLASRIVYQNRWMRVREDAIRRSDGREGVYGVVEKPDFVVIAPIENGLIHLVEQYRYPVQQRYWELPQGSWEDQPGTDPVVLARAELREETGLSAAVLIEAGYLHVGYGYSTQGYHVYLASGFTNGERDLDVEEAGLITRAFALADVERMICDGTIRDATTIAVMGLLKLKGLI
jgi:8-oxo-dGTP pyrophosphatase MutT (NUDIX family)